MTKPRYLFLANAMIIANALANMSAVVAIKYLMRATLISASPETLNFTMEFNRYYSFCAFIFSVSVLFLYEQPIRRCLKRSK